MLTRPRNNATELNVAFICNDYVLRNAAIQRLKDDKRFLAFESVKDFEAYLRLTKEKLTSEFISKIRFRATKKFFSQNDPTCLINRDKLLERIQREHQLYFYDVSKSQGTDLEELDFHSAEAKGEQWTAQTRGTYWLDPPEFLRIEKEKRYFWRSRLLFVRLYSRSAGVFTMTAGPLDMKRLLKLPFEITWSSMIKDDARFYEIQAEAIELKGNSFKAPSEDELKKYNLTPLRSETNPAGGP